MNIPDVRFRDEITARRLPHGAGAIKTYESLYSRYAQSDFGRFHATQPLRYSQNFGYEPGQMLADLGDDVHPVRHMWHTEQNVLRPFLLSQNTHRDRDFEYIVPEQVAALRSGVLLHGIGECEDPRIKQAIGLSVGDKFYETRTQQDNLNEAKVRRYLYDQLFQDVNADFIGSAEDIIAGSRDHFLEQAFNTVEIIGYYQTAMTAGAVVLKSLEASAGRPEPSHRLLALGRLAVRVRDNHYPTLHERTASYPYTTTVLSRHTMQDLWVDTGVREFVADQSEKQQQG